MPVLATEERRGRPAKEPYQEQMPYRMKGFSMFADNVRQPIVFLFMANFGTQEIQEISTEVRGETVDKLGLPYPPCSCRQALIY
jgi:hypothetical protein